MKTILKSALFLFLPLIFNSCSEDEALPEKNAIEISAKNHSKNGDQLLRGENPQELYNAVVDSRDQNETYQSLNPRQKSLVWQGKYDDFLDNSELNEEELGFINNLKSTLTEEFFTDIESNYNSDDIKLLEIKAGQLFGTARGLSLFYSMETVYKNNTAATERNCFWCNNLLVSVDGPCHIEYFNGVPQYVEAVTIKKTRFWITTGTYESVQACTP